MKYRDSHVHLLDCHDSAIAIHQALKSGIRQFFNNTTSVKQWQPCVDLSQKHPEVVPFLGLHPWFVSPEIIPELAALPSLLDATGAGVGEIGLDKRCKTDFSLQKQVFISQVEIAIDKQAFFSVHCVRAWGSLLAILEKYTNTMSFMVHGFNGSQETMERLVSLGGMLSFSGKLAEPSHKKLREVFLATPLSHLLLETDAPNQLSPTLAVKNKLTITENTPAMVVSLYQYCASIRKMDLNKFTKQIWHNGTIFED